MQKNALSTQPYKGATDFYPKDMIVRNHLFNIWADTAKEFGYEEYDTPILEEAVLYRAKSGDELANTQLYNFFDKGGREVAIRPEMTPSVARIIAAKFNELQKPIRWFNIGKFYRYEKPQKGRDREFSQLNFDIFGVSEMTAEIEVFKYVGMTMKKLGAPKGSYKIYVNNRYLLDYFFDNVMNLDQSMRKATSRAIDNFPKLKQGDFELTLEDIGLNKSQIDSLLDFMSYSLDDVRKLVTKSRGADELIATFDLVDELNLDYVEFKPSIMRGITYYTGTVFEIFDTGGENPRALGGGGRYDDLLELFGGDKLPAVGFAMGNITMVDFMRTYNLLPEIKPETEVYCSLMDKKYYSLCSEITDTLRSEGIKVEQQLVEMPFGKQLGYADKKGFRYVIIIGEDEVAKGVVAVKDLKNKSQQFIKKEDLPSFFRE